MHRENMSQIDVEIVAKEIVDSAIKVHRALGIGLLESAYQTCLAHELGHRGLLVQCEVVLPIQYEGIAIESAYRIDMLVEIKIVIENKTVEKILPIHEAQLLTYLKMSKSPLGFLLNWYSAKMVDGIRRKINSKAAFIY